MGGACCEQDVQWMGGSMCVVYNGWNVGLGSTRRKGDRVFAKWLALFYFILFFVKYVI